VSKALYRWFTGVKVIAISKVALGVDTLEVVDVALVISVAFTTLGED
jgi:hypothetical protein